MCETLVKTGAEEEAVACMKVTEVEGSQGIRVSLSKILFAW